MQVCTVSQQLHISKHMSACLQGLDHVIFVTPQNSKLLLLRQYSIVFKKSGTRIPRVELAEMGPSLNLSIRRTREAPTELANESMKQAKVAKRKVRTCMAGHVHLAGYMHGCDNNSFVEPQDMQSKVGHHTKCPACSCKSAEYSARGALQALLPRPPSSNAPAM